MMEDSKNDKNSFWTRRISIWHVIYVIIIAFIINIFLLCILPGRVNDDAYQNFSFAATITSIVLAVVSIVYSLQSGISSLGQLNSIKEIEGRIGNELSRFSSLENSIKNAVKEGISPLEASMGSIQQRQDDIQRSQDELRDNWNSVIEGSLRMTTGTSNNKEVLEESFLSQENAPQIFSVIFYTCVRSHETGKDIPFHVLRKFFGVRSYYCEGVIKSISIFNAGKLTLKQGSKQTRIVVDSYDSQFLGSKKWLKEQILKGTNIQLGRSITQALDGYFDMEEEKDAVL